MTLPEVGLALLAASESTVPIFVRLLQIIPDSQANSMADIPWFNRSPLNCSQASPDKLKVCCDPQKSSGHL